MTQKALNLTYDWRFTGAGLPAFTPIESNAQKVSDNFDELFALAEIGGQAAIDVGAGFVANAASIAANLAALATALDVEVGTIDEAVDFLFTGAGVPGFETRAESNAVILDAAFDTLYAAPPAPSWEFLGTTFLRSDGMAGSYADAATSALARTVFPGASAPVFTVSCWATPTAYTSGLTLMQISDGGPTALTCVTNDDAGYYVTVASTADDGSAAGETSGAVHVAIVCDGASLYVYENAVQKASTALPAEPYAAVDAFTLFADYVHANRFAGDIAQLAVWGRALSALEVADIYASGRAFDLRTVGDNEDYDGTTGGPPHWYPGDGDTGTTITDRGSAGDCNLTLHGGVSIEVDP